jgi:hypothetical protein
MLMILLGVVVDDASVIRAAVGVDAFLLLLLLFPDMDRL